MKNTSFSRRKLLWLLGMAAINPAHAFFGSGIVHDPAHTAQTVAAEIARAADATREIQIQMNQYQNMVRNALSLGDPLFSPIGNTLRSLYQIYMQGQSIGWQLQNLDQQFSSMYPSYQSWVWTMGQGQPTFSTRYKTWSDQNAQSVRQALVSSGMQIDRMEDEGRMLERLISRSASAEGRMQAIQAGNEIAVMQIQQLQQLRMMMYDHTKMQAAYLAYENDRRSAADAFRARYRESQVIHTPGKEF